MQISQIAEIDKIGEISNAIVAELQPEQIYLFGSFAKGTQRDDSDYDLYVIVDGKSSEEDMLDLSARAYYSLYKNKVKQHRAVDILVNSKRNFESSKDRASLARVITRTGVMLYDKTA